MEQFEAVLADAAREGVQGLYIIKRRVVTAISVVRIMMSARMKAITAANTNSTPRPAIGKKKKHTPNNISKNAPL